MHFDTRLAISACLSIVHLTTCLCQYADEQSYLSLVDFHRGGNATQLILGSPHGGSLGANLTLSPLPVAGCYNTETERCVYTVQDCLRADGELLSFRADARCVIDRSSSPSIHLLTKSIAEAFKPTHRPFTILNKLTRQYVDPAEDLSRGTFLVENAVRSYNDYHRLIAISKEAIRLRSPGLYIELVFHRISQTVFLGYGFESGRSAATARPALSTVTDLISRVGLNVIAGNSSLSSCLRRNGFESVIPLGPQKYNGTRLSTYSTRVHADQRLNTILFSYPVERLRTHSLKQEGQRIAKAIDEFISSVDCILFVMLLFLSQALAIQFIYH
jgi:hypothetical protein